MRELNVVQLIDERPVSRYQLRVFLLCAAVVFLDGIDYQVIGIAAPLISKELGIDRSQLGWVFSAGTLGACLGALTAGLAADRIGRKITLIAATLLVGLTTIATAFAGSLGELIALRFITGLGLGGAAPCFIALTSEYAPLRRRATITALVWAALPLGGMTGGFVNAYLLQTYDWKHLFWLWGIAPAMVAIALIFWLPESVRFLLTRAADGQHIRNIVARIQRAPLSSDTILVGTDERLPGLPLQHLFSDGRVRGTLALWTVLFIVLGTLTVMSTWTPALVTQYGYSASQAAIIVAFNGLGSFIGSSSAGRLIERLGVARSMIPAFAIASIAVMLFGSAAQGGFGELVAASLLAGVFLGIGSTSGIALSALVYPTAIRSTGIGWALGIGRFGSVFCPLAIGMLVGMQISVRHIFIVVGLWVLCAVPCIILLYYYGRAQPMPGVSSDPITQTS